MRVVLMSAGAVYALAAITPAWVDHLLIGRPVLWSWALTYAGLSQFASACVGVEIVRLLRPPRVLVYPGTLMHQAIAGMFVGFAGVLLGMIALSLLSWHWGDPMVQTFALSLGALAGAAGALLCCPRVRPNHCPRCGYDRTALTLASRGICPECGHDPSDSFARNPA